ncbi:MAG: 30S ribosomal protein S17 [Thermoanaerobaculia bacterium]|nr:30S ribosomal protein S17 [Thermoanaerobaculia bacterium]
MTTETGNTSNAGSAAGDRGRRQVLVGTVVGDKMDKTVVVAVENVVMDRLYHRYAKRTSKFYAHDEANECRTGDQVEIVASRPLSRLKRWRVSNVIRRSDER